MIKQLAAGFLAVATTGALALSLSAPAQATTTSSAGRATTTAAAHDYWDFSDTWNASSRNYQAKVEGWIKVRGQYDEGNTIKVGGKLYDLDNRTSDEGGLCAYVKFQTSDDEHNWSYAYDEAYCGYPGYKRFSFRQHDVYAVRAKVCQRDESATYTRKCGPWTYLYDEGDNS